MRQAGYLAILAALLANSVAMAQLPEVVYNWAGSGTQQWQTWGSHNQPFVLPNFNTATISAATGDLVVTETGTGGKVGKELWIFDYWGRPREDASALDEEGGLDATGLDYIEVDLRHNHPTGTVYVDFLTQHWNGETWWGGSDGTVVKQEPGALVPPAHPVGPGLNTIRFPISQLPARNQAYIDLIWLATQAHETLGNVTWTISQVRTAGTPLTYRDIVTNNVGSPDDGIDGALPLNTADMLAIAGNMGVANQEGLSRNPSGSGSLQWTDTGHYGDELNNVSGASIGWGSGAGWRNVQPGIPTDGNNYNQRTANFWGYDRMTVTISALDAVNPAGTVGIEAPFIRQELGTILPSQNLATDGQYHELVYDLSGMEETFLKNVWNWGLDVAPHPNDIVFNIDNIRLWNSTTPVGVPGDYNGNGTVDAADYVLWRNGGTLQNEGATPGSNTPDDYTFWRSRFGATSGSGATLAAAVPEASSMMMVVTAIYGIGWIRRTCRRAV